MHSDDASTHVGDLKEDPNSIEDRLRQLQETTRQLGTFSRLILVGILVELLVFSSVYLFGRINTQYTLDPLFAGSIFVMAAFCSFAMTVFLMIRRDATRRAGQAIYEELSDEVQWSVANSRDNSPDPQEMLRHPPHLTIRVILRQFIHETHLPMAPSQSAESTYLFIATGIFIASLLFLGAYL